MGRMRSVLFTATFALTSLSSRANFQTPQLEIPRACAKEMNELDFWQAIARISSRMELNDLLEGLVEPARHKKTTIERLERLATHSDSMIREQTIDFLRKKLSYAWMAQSVRERAYLDEIAGILEKSLDWMVIDKAKDTAREITGYYVRNRRWNELMVLVVEHPDQRIRLEVRLAIEYLAEIQSYRREMPAEVLRQIQIDRPDPDRKKKQ